MDSETLTEIRPTKEALDRLSARLAVHFGVAPIRVESDGVLIVAMEEPAEVDVLDELNLTLGCVVRGERASAEAVKKAIREHYGVGADTLEKLVDTRDIQVIGELGDADIDDQSADASIIKFVNELIVDAYNSRATDIHLEPFEHKLRVRYRIDGILFEAHIPESIRHFRDAIVSRVKIMAGLDIAERRVPQDGRIKVRISQSDFDVRVSVIPIAHGESVNLRLLQRSSVLLGLEAIGFSKEMHEKFLPLLKKTHGIILLTGPTGSGKTTTLYACLHQINQTDRKIITIEDPVEYQIEGICQMQTRPDIGFTFATGLRSMLRHDPDVMLVGEIRDFETAELAIRCALTGHLVFSTLHTNDAAGTIPRLTDIGIEPYLLASSIEAVMAQRLVRKICPECDSPYGPDPEVLRDLDEAADGTNTHFRQGTGCQVCRNSGYLGRTAIHEMFIIDDDIRHLIISRSPGSAIKKEALNKGMDALRDDGLKKARRGITTIDEVLRVTQESA